MSQELNDYISAYTGSEIDQMLRSASDAKEYAERAEQALLGIVDIEKAAPMIIGQVVKNRDAIGLVRVNLLPIPDGDLELSTVPAGGLPSTISITGSRATGGITVAIDDVVYQDTFFGANVAKLSMLGTGTDDTGAIQPGTYKLSFTDTSTDQILSRQRLEVTVVVDSTATTYSCTLASACEFVVPDEFDYVRITYKADVERYSGVASSIIYPFLRELALADEPFEPYKPDLQTQINDKVGVSDMTAGFDRIYDTFGVMGSINLFPIDKGTPSDPVTVELTGGTFIIQKGNNLLPPWIAFEGTSDDSDKEEYQIYFNNGYKFDGNPFLFGDLAPDDYVISFDVVEDNNFTPYNAITLEVYESATPPGLSYGSLIAITTGDDIDFTVSANKPYITIIAVAQRLYEGHDWTGESIAVTPFLRRKIFAESSFDHYKPPVNKQLAEIRDKLANMGGYNEVQSDTVTDEIEEVTT